MIWLSIFLIGVYILLGKGVGSFKETFPPTIALIENTDKPKNIINMNILLAVVTGFPKLV
tara:strand:+ start:957 stop:1136 length:180 start_codon:yes stop_codon:yes gene_type:complete